METARGGPWRLVRDGARDPLFNMALDQVLASRVARGEAPPTLRFYTWDRPAISLGFHQDPSRVLNMEEVRRLGLSVVRRPTGGRAVLHGHDLTYAVALPTSLPWVSTLMETYRALSEALREGFLRAGVPVTLARGHVGELRPGPLPCFASTARYELVWRGRKVVGSAQRRFKGAVLQQGSIPLRRAPVWLDRVWPEASSYDHRWAPVEEVVGAPVDAGELASTLAEGFRHWLGVDLVESPLDPEELDAATEACHESP